eukprot:GHVP01040013.1.p1 GENE.GHVP01040013.1~~GHVP01040013.1.p1  ORF type:complete len:168 (-),score=43.70 GHVP01040013.1:10-513(-)
MEILKKFTDEAYSAVSGPNLLHEDYAIDDPLFKGGPQMVPTLLNFSSLKRALALNTSSKPTTDDELITEDEPITEDEYLKRFCVAPNGSSVTDDATTDNTITEEAMTDEEWDAMKKNTRDTFADVENWSFRKSLEKHNANVAKLRAEKERAEKERANIDITEEEASV